MANYCRAVTKSPRGTPPFSLRTKTEKTKRFKLAEQRWRAYPWGGVRVALRMFLQMELSILYS